MTIWDGAKWQKFKCACGYSWLRPIGFLSKEICPACKLNECKSEPFV